MGAETSRLFVQEAATVIIADVLDAAGEARRLHRGDESSYCNGSELAGDGGMAAGTYYAGVPGSPGLD